MFCSSLIFTFSNRSISDKLLYLSEGGHLVVHQVEVLGTNSELMQTQDED